jgi:tetratricopeptide (TPR) repeat protein
MKNVYLIEDHDEALKVWRRIGVKSCDLVHIDAHIDFGFRAAEPLEKVINEAKSLKELKQRLEYSLSFLNYEKDFRKQTNIGNYIYPAIEENIVNNVYWVIPGRIDEFKKSKKLIRGILRDISKGDGRKNNSLSFLEEKEILSACISGIVFKVCVLDTLPCLSRDILLDIDTDFLVIDSIRSADNTKNIGKRKPWIMPQDLARAIKEKVKRPKAITIAYSVNGGWTPIKYKYLGDDLAYRFAPKSFRRRLRLSRQAAEYFNLFAASGKKIYYRMAIKLDPAYRVTDNNYGPLYLSLGRFSSAQREFKRILWVDKRNPAAIFGLGLAALGKKEFRKAKRYFCYSLRFINNQRLFAKTKKQIALGLGKAEFYLNNFKQAKKHLLYYNNLFPLEPESYFFLGRIFEKEKDFLKAAIFYKDTIRLGLNNIMPLFRLLKISHRLEDKSDIIKYIRVKYRVLKKELLRSTKLRQKKKKIGGYSDFKRKMSIMRKALKVEAEVSL